uniref:Uncharacterized protein n=1 Tax=Strigamia maritima TaxID=126957 RepID=T1JGJ5_STRMM
MNSGNVITDKPRRRPRLPPKSEIHGCRLNIRKVFSDTLINCASDMTGKGQGQWPSHDITTS